jgi:hypothetical protein
MFATPVPSSFQVLILHPPHPDTLQNHHWAINTYNKFTYYVFIKIMLHHDRS